MFFLALMGCAFFIKLGFWQLHRAEEKYQMLALEAEGNALAPIAWRKTDKPPQQYQRVKSEGHFLNTIFLLDNQHHNHQFGFHVLSPLQLKDGGIVLVDRGFIEGDRTRRTYPSIETPKGLIQVTGMAYYPNLSTWVLGPMFEKIQKDMVIIEQLNIKAMGDLLDKSVSPFILRMGEHEKHGFIRIWPTVAMNPSRHKAYAVQWFALALAVGIIFISLSLKKSS